MTAWRRERLWKDCDSLSVSVCACSRPNAIHQRVVDHEISVNRVNEQSLDRQLTVTDVAQYSNGENMFGSRAAFPYQTL